MAMIKENKNVINAVWRGETQGAGVYCYSEQSAFSRVLNSRTEHHPQVLGAHFENGLWMSHPEGIAGPIPDDKYINILLPSGTQKVGFNILSGLVSGLPLTCGACFTKKHPTVQVVMEPCCSGTIVKVIPYSQP